MPIDPSFAVSGVTGAEWTIPSVDMPESTEPTRFGSLLGDSLRALEETQTDAAMTAQDLASFKAAAQTIFQTQV